MSKHLRFYHATCATANKEGGYDSFPKILEPRKQKTVLGEEGYFVFAGANLPMAVAYALKTRQGEPHTACVDATRLTRSGVPVNMMFGYEFLDKHPEGRIFEVPTDTFEAVTSPNGQETGEWVSRKPVVPTAIKSVSLNSAMRVGVQIFVHTSRDSRDIYRQEMKAVMQEQDPMLREELYFSILKKLVGNGQLIHLNQERGLNPINLDTMKLEDDSFIKNPDKIHDLPGTPSSVRKFRLQPEEVEQRQGKSN